MLHQPPMRERKILDCARLNAYFVDAGEQNLIVDYIDGWARSETVRICNIVVTSSRGRAKQIFIDWANKVEQAYLEWTDPISIKKLKEVEGYKEGTVKDNDPLWELLNKDNTNYKKVAEILAEKLAEKVDECPVEHETGCWCADIQDDYSPCPIPKGKNNKWCWFGWAAWKAENENNN